MDVFATNLCSKTCIYTNCSTTTQKRPYTTQIHTGHLKNKPQFTFHFLCVCYTHKVCTWLIVVKLFHSLLLQGMVIGFVHQLARLSHLSFESTLHGFSPEAPEMVSRICNLEKLRAICSTMLKGEKLSWLRSNSRL